MRSYSSRQRFDLVVALAGRLSQYVTSHVDHFRLAIPSWIGTMRPAKQVHREMHWPRGLAAKADVWLRTSEMEIGVTLWAHVSLKDLMLLKFRLS